MNSICFVTSTRAEYGLLRPLIKRVAEDDELQMRLVVTGTHLSHDYGYTLKEIKADRMEVYREIEVLTGELEEPTGKVMGRTLEKFTEFFHVDQPDLVVVLGDRFEMLAVVLAADSEQIPVAHLHGGEITKGAKDDAYRHCITKLSKLHFAATREYADRIVQMGENPETVFCVGALGVENICREELFSKDSLYKELQLPSMAEYAVVTFHPVTAERSDAEAQIWELLKAMETIEKSTGIYFVMTKANADAQGSVINRVLEEYVKEKGGDSHFRLYASLGMKRYLSSLKYARFVLGNSSSGIIEAPSFGIPTVNIGSRQEGRIMADSVINCISEERDILRGIELALSREGTIRAKNVKNPYGDGNTSEKILAIIKSALLRGIPDEKDFYDLPCRGIGE